MCAGRRVMVPGFLCVLNQRASEKRQTNKYIYSVFVKCQYDAGYLSVLHSPLTPMPVPMKRKKETKNEKKHKVSFTASALAQKPFPFNNLGSKLDQKHGFARPHVALADGMRRHFGGKVGAVTDALDDAGHKRRTVELAHFAGHADVLVYEGLIVDNHVLVRRVGVVGLFQPIGLSAKEVLPHVLLNKMQQRDDGQGAQLRARRLAVEQEVEQLETDRVALRVEAIPRGRRGRVSQAWSLR